jgi:hypothetical protein
MCCIWKSGIVGVKDFIEMEGWEKERRHEKGRKWQPGREPVPGLPDRAWVEVSWDLADWFWGFSFSGSESEFCLCGEYLTSELGILVPCSPVHGLTDLHSPSVL